MGIDLARLREMWDATAPPAPVYPAWFKQPKKPNAQKVSEIALRRFDELSEWRMAVRHDLMVLRNSVEGIFNDDREDYYAGILDEWSSPALVDEFNLAVSWLSGLNRRFTKPGLPRNGSIRPSGWTTAAEPERRAVHLALSAGLHRPSPARLSPGRARDQANLPGLQRPCRGLAGRLRGL